MNVDVGRRDEYSSEGKDLSFVGLRGCRGWVLRRRDQEKSERVREPLAVYRISTLLSLQSCYVAFRLTSISVKFVSPFTFHRDQTPRPSYISRRIQHVDMNEYLWFGKHRCASKFARHSCICMAINLINAGGFSNERNLSLEAYTLDKDNDYPRQISRRWKLEWRTNEMTNSDISFDQFCPRLSFFLKDHVLLHPSDIPALKNIRKDRSSPLSEASISLEQKKLFPRVRCHVLFTSFPF